MLLAVIFLDYVGWQESNMSFALAIPFGRFILLSRCSEKASSANSAKSTEEANYDFSACEQQVQSC
jgi:hypothetical protein